MDSLQRQKTDLDSKMKQLTHEISESTKRVEKLGEHIKMYETSLEEQKRIRTELQGEVHTSKGILYSKINTMKWNSGAKFWCVLLWIDKLSTLQKGLDDVNMKLGDARVDKHEEARRKKKQEIVETFKSHFPGVVRIMKSK